MGVALVVVAAAVAGGCSGQMPTACTADMRLGLGIVVVNDQTEAHICDAVVVARSGAYSETLRRTSDARVSGCLYVGAAERSGSYSVQADAAGFSPNTLGNLMVPLSKDGCHVEQVIGTIRLVPTGGG
jgi:hypothetical protein